MNMGKSGFLVKFFFSVWLVVCSVSVLSFDANDQFVSDFDLDDDQQVTREEFTNARREKYNDTDEDKNDSVDENEYVDEYANRIDIKIEEERKGHIKQTNIRFKALDKNESNSLEWDEYKKSGDRSFNRYDTDENLVIDDNDEAPKKHRKKADVKATKKDKKSDKAYASNNEARRKKYSRRVVTMPTTHRKQGMLDKYDVNSDDIVEYDEFNQKRQADFDLTDENKNGVLDKDEYLNEYLNRLDVVIENTRKQKIKQASVRFGVLDRDSDGSMTFEEYQISGNRRFACKDGNSDGVVMASDNASDDVSCQHGSKIKGEKAQRNKMDKHHKVSASAKPHNQAAVSLK